MMIRSDPYDFARHPMLECAPTYTVPLICKSSPREPDVLYSHMIRRSFASKCSIFATTSRQNWADYRQCRHIWTLPPYCEPGEQATQYHHGPGRQGFMPTLYSQSWSKAEGCRIWVLYEYHTHGSGWFYLAKKDTRYVKIFQEPYSSAVRLQS